MSYFALGKMVGILFGVVLGLLICFFAFKILNKNGKTRTEYDERQNKIRGEAYRWAFWTETAYLGVLMLVEEAEIALPVDSIVKLFFGFFLAGSVLSSYCIWNGAYFGLNNIHKRWYIFITIFGFVNLGVAAKGFVTGSIVQDGVLSYPCVNLLCGVLLFEILGVIFARKTIDRLQETE